MKVTLISDTHSKHRNCELDLPGGDLLIHAGDFMNSGYNPMEAIEFFQWFDKINNYNHKIFIAGNHDRWMQDKPEEGRSILAGYETIDYLEDDWMTVGDSDPHDPNVNTAKIYGSPWQPEFRNWAFNLPRHGEEMKAKWDAIPTNTDILITHGPPFGYLDIPGGQSIRVGCEMLRHRVDEIRPKIHVFGHIHGGRGYYYNGHTHFFNASILDERYSYANLPFTFEWDSATNEIKWQKD